MPLSMQVRLLHCAVNVWMRLSADFSIDLNPLQSIATHGHHILLRPADDILCPYHLQQSIFGEKFQI